MPVVLNRGKSSSKKPLGEKGEGARRSREEMKTGKDGALRLIVLGYFANVLDHLVHFEPISTIPRDCTTLIRIF